MKHRMCTNVFSLSAVVPCYRFTFSSAPFMTMPQLHKTRCFRLAQMSTCSRSFARFCISDIQPLTAMLSVQVKQEPIPWVRLLIEDFHIRWLEVDDLWMLPDPRSDPAAWWRFAKNCPAEWRSAVMKHWTPVSITDVLTTKRAATPSASPTSTSSSTFTCKRCGPHVFFETKKKFWQHQRRQHSVVLRLQYLVDGSYIYPGCLLKFSTRTQVCPPLSDRRCALSGRALVASLPNMPAAEVRHMLDADAESRKKARRQGHSHPLTCGKPVRVEGPLARMPTQAVHEPWELVSAPPSAPAQQKPDNEARTSRSPQAEPLKKQPSTPMVATAFALSHDQQVTQKTKLLAMPKLQETFKCSPQMASITGTLRSGQLSHSAAA